MSRLIAGLTLWLALIVPASSSAADAAWPTQPVRLIVPGDAGGVLDIRARWLADRLTPLLGRSVIVDNRAGAGGTIGTEAGAKSPPDGHTVTVIHLGTMAINPHLYGRLGYDPLTDSTPITQVSTGPLVLVVHSSVPAGNLAELVRLAKAQPGQMNFGSGGIDVVHVPHKGGAQAVASLLAGQTAFMVENPSVLLQHIRSGRLRALAVTGAARLKSLPDVPTVAEAGVPDFEFVAWTGLAVPAGTPKPIVERLYREIRELMKTPAAAEWLELIGSYPRTDAPDVFAQSIRADHARWGKIIRDAGIRLE